MVRNNPHSALYQFETESKIIISVRSLQVHESSPVQLLYQPSSKACSGILPVSSNVQAYFYTGCNPGKKGISEV